MTSSPAANDHASAPVEAGDPVRDTRAFRRSLGQYATGVTIITARAGGRMVGLTANSFSSVSLEPPLILWSLARTSESLSVFVDATHFAVNVLTPEQIALASRFARSGGDKFADVGFRPGRGEAPLLPGVAASFECRREALHDTGDHMIVIGLVERFARFNRPGLLFAQGRYSLAVDHPGFAQEGTAPPDAAPRANETMLTLLRKAYGRLSAAFQVHRDAEGVTVNQGRVLTHLEQNPHASADTIARECFLGPLDAEEAAAALIARGYVVREADGSLGISAEGRHRMDALRLRVVAFENERLQGLPAASVEATRRVLQALSNPVRAA